MSSIIGGDMSGHSKWANIKRKKGVNDKIKGNVFGKMSRLITMSVTENGGLTNPDDNVRLRLAIEKAKSFNMPKENIERAIDKAVGPEKSQLKEVVYEGFAPYGVSLIILATTDSQNRTLSEVRNVLERHNSKLGSSGSVGYLFKKCALIIFEKTVVNQEKILEIGDLLEAFDIDEDDSRFSVYFPFENLGHIKDKIKDIVYVSAEIDYKPQSSILIEDEKKLHIINDIIEALEVLDDVQTVFTNIC